MYICVCVFMYIYINSNRKIGLKKRRTCECGRAFTISYYSNIRAGSGLIKYVRKTCIWDCTLHFICVFFLQHIFLETNLVTN